MKLCQVLAIESGVRSKSQTEITALHRAAERQELYSGANRTYRPKDEDGEKFGDENQITQLRSKEVLEKLKSILTEAYDTELTKDVGNLKALATVKTAEGDVICADVPVSYLLYLEKRLEDLNTFVTKMPTLDSAERWTWDETTNQYRAETTETVKTKKKTTPVVLYPATKEHPAQVKESVEDVVVGYWKLTKFSGAMPADEKQAILGRLQKLQHAVKFAREEANSTEVQKQKAAEKIFAYLF
jgi:hypothetical protein